MLYTVTFSFPKEEVLAIGQTLLPNADPAEILQSSTVIVTEWIETIIKRRVKELMERKNDV